jgi:membrane associated rhomboid family serine protease
MPSIIVLGLWFVLQVVSQLGGAGGGVAFMAHIGGFVAGMALVFLFGAGREAPAAPRAGGRF